MCACECVSPICICIVCGQAATAAAAAVRRCFTGAHDDDVDARTEQTPKRERARESAVCKREAERKTHTLSTEPGQLIATKRAADATRLMFMTPILSACLYFYASSQSQSL